MTAVAESPALAVEHPPIYWETILQGWTRAEGREYGKIEPRKWTKPLRPLAPETSAGFDVIEFGEDVCGIVLYPWQRWLLIHALELNEDGTYRFKRVHLLVGRQNGKTTLAKLLTASRLWERHLFPLGVEMILDALDAVGRGGVLPTIPQNDALATWEPSFAAQPVYRPELLEIEP